MDLDSGVRLVSSVRPLNVQHSKGQQLNILHIRYTVGYGLDPLPLRYLLYTMVCVGSHTREFKLGVFQESAS